MKKNCIKILFVFTIIFISKTIFTQNDTELPNSENIPSSLMTFFVTSEPIGDGGNLGGLEGADKHCQRLATEVGAGNKTWRAYLSTQARPGKPAINARDRIGDGPWYNFNGEMIARNLSHLHGDTIELARLGNNITKQSGLTEKGQIVPGLNDYQDPKYRNGAIRDDDWDVIKNTPNRTTKK